MNFDELKSINKAKLPDASIRKIEKQIKTQFKKDFELKNIEKFKKEPGSVLVTFQLDTGRMLRLAWSDKSGLVKEEKEILLDKLITYASEMLVEATLKESELFLGRFQPLHLGHATVIGKMKNPVVALVKGGKTGLDKSKNPLSLKDQARLIKKAYPNAKVIEVANGYIPDIVEELLKLNIKITAVWAGEDRRAAYVRQMKNYDKANPDKAQNLTFKPTFNPDGERIGGTSATLVRKAIRDGDKETFLKHMPKKLHSEWAFLQKKLG